MTLIRIPLCLLLLSLLNTPCTSQLPGLRPNCAKILNWVPLRMKKPFTSLLNNEFCPSWVTRDFFTKRRTNGEMRVPRGIPMSLACGFCVLPSSELEASFNITAAGEVLPKVYIKNNDGSVLHRSRGYKCRVTYAISGPIERSGTYRCQVGFGSRSFTEDVSYSVTDPDITELEEEINLTGREVKLTCPAHPTEETVASPLTHTWYYPLSPTPRVAAPTTAPSVTFHLSSTAPLVVSCATYHLNSATEVVVKTFKVRRSSAPARRITHVKADSAERNEVVPNWDESHQYGAFGETDNSAAEVYSSNTATGGSYTLLLSLLCVFCAVVTLVAVFIGYQKYQDVRRRRRSLQG